MSLIRLFGQSWDVKLEGDHYIVRCGRCEQEFESPGIPMSKLDAHLNRHQRLCRARDLLPAIKGS